jgi:glycine/D-amino acid oxidase-like deaminating enzyme
MDKPGIDRRSMLTGAAGVAGASVALGAKAQVAARRGAPAIGHNLPDVAIVGAGAFGAFTALEMRERGAKVTLVDAYGPGNPRASSGGESRNIRGSYGEREIYTRWAMESWDLWHQRQEQFGRRLIYPNGSLRVLAPEAMAAQLPIFDRLGLPYEVLPGDEVSRRWPQYRFRPDEKVFFEKRSGSVKAQAALVAACETFQQKGGQMRIGRAAPGAKAGGRLTTITVDGEPLAGGTFMFACGPWLPKVFPELLGDRIECPRAELFFIGSPPGDERYRWEHVPNITDRERYTSADSGGGYKIAAKHTGALMDPDTGDRMPSAELLAQIKDYVSRRLPGLVGQPVVQSYVCQTEVTDNSHYVIDTHPDLANLWIAGGGSGHAFKMAPKLGRYLADCLSGRPQPAESARLFTLAAHGSVRAARGNRRDE